MAYEYDLFVDTDKKFTRSCPDAASLAADAIEHGKRFAPIVLSAQTVADAISGPAHTIDLRLRPPQITIRVRAL